MGVVSGHYYTPEKALKSFIFKNIFSPHKSEEYFVSIKNKYTYTKSVEYSLIPGLFVSMLFYFSTRLICKYIILF